MADIQEIVDRYIATFNEEDADRRRAEISALYSPDGTYTDPHVELCGLRRDRDRRRQGAGRLRLPRRDVRILTMPGGGMKWACGCGRSAGRGHTEPQTQALTALD
jgi:plasmid stabilization system protein ParE